MHDGPFRQRPKLLMCPRCGEMLERAFDAVHACLRCEGVWIAPVSLDKAFGDPRWPHARSMWWRASLACPECASEGAVRTMVAAAAGSVMVDRCASHGLWLDRGELGRLMGGDTANDDGDDDLAQLRALVRANESDLAELLDRRQKFRADSDVRADDARKRLAQLEAQLAAQRQRELEREEQRRRAEQELRNEEARRQAAERERQQAEEAYAAELRRRREQARRRSELVARRRDATADIAHLETQLTDAHDVVAKLEAALAVERARLHRIDDELKALTDDVV
ncbi:MAG TPA: zf-TFIIB domain-containing protein [Kofleriaceae bacterium]|nr:zf-TFIIB domain-containing protein [Kofleriaceae bacterium]